MTKLCACGCDKPVIGKRPEAIYHSNACKVRAHKQRQEVAALATLETPETPLPRFKPTTRRVLRALQAAGGRGATTAELSQSTVGGFRFGARILELRDAGLRIDAKKLANGQWRYWLRDSETVSTLFSLHAPADPHAHIRDEAAA